MISFMTSLNVWNSTEQSSKQMFQTLQQKHKTHSTATVLYSKPKKKKMHETQNRGLM